MKRALDNLTDGRRSGAGHRLPHPRPHSCRSLRLRINRVHAWQCSARAARGTYSNHERSI